MLGGLFKGIGKALGSIGKAVGGFLGGPWGQLALTVAPALFGRRGGGGGGEQTNAAEQAAAFQREMAQHLLSMANQIQIPPALAPMVFARLKAQALSTQPQLPAGVAVPGLRELVQAKGMALAQQAGAQQQLADYDAQMRALAQRAQLISGAAGLAGGAGGAYQQLAEMMRQQQAGQLAGWAQLMPQIASLFRRQQQPQTQWDAIRPLGVYLRR